MRQQELPEWLWSWMLSVERRLTRNEERLGTKTTERGGERQQWAARDWLMTGAGITLVLGSLSEKSGVTAAGAMLLKAVVRLYGER